MYNLGGGRDNAASVLECIALIEELSPYRVRHSLSDVNRVGDHICYISDLRKLKSHFPDWRLTMNLRDIIGTMIDMEASKKSA